MQHAHKVDKKFYTSKIYKTYDKSAKSPFFEGDFALFGIQNELTLFLPILYIIRFSKKISAFTKSFRLLFHAILVFSGRFLGILKFFKALIRVFKVLLEPSKSFSDDFHRLFGRLPEVFGRLPKAIRTAIRSFSYSFQRRFGRLSEPFQSMNPPKSTHPSLYTTADCPGAVFSGSPKVSVALPSG